MNAFIKNCLKIAGISILLGLFLILISFSMDNTIFSNWENFNIPFGNNNYHSGRWSNSDKEDRDDWDKNDWSNKEAEEDKNELISDNTESKGTEGNTGIRSSGNTNNLRDVKSLALDISYGTVSIKEGEHFDIQVDNIGSNDYYSTVNEGVWKIGDNRDDNRSEFSIFGVEISDSVNHPFRAANIELTIPEDFVFENLDIILNAGTIKAERLSSKNADIDVGAGSLHIEELSASEKSSYSIDTGQLVIENISAQDANINCGVGNLTAAGVINGDSLVTCGIGNVSLAINGNENDYNYNVDCGIGTVIINDNSYSGVNSKHKTNNNAKNSFDLDCGIGKIALEIQK
ncbi:DUF4097 family beta strand repeat-containing protein [Anaerocolumna sp. MB42-C2]|uniref:DUF4097 family beta strand repeat-containing protein n=1 Tax=Anaerocolumna sp. MB42-C2 TaxID=3070997 RepID=UPI0027E00F72|nr:DUF4097 family beta strand repeat-containing protein [Anaerocolumna sp. MB42-C2]WMJ88745.1 DUF4097 family beta strand repeat-containing protein [Anaerocolumna sp. MB42-C2]